MPEDEVTSPSVKPTLEIESPPEWVTALAAKIEAARQEVRALHIEVSAIDDRQRADAERLAKASGGVRELSGVDLKHDAIISEIMVKVDALTASQTRQVAILERLDKIAENPMVRRVAYAIGVALLTYLTTRGLLPQ